jgi:FkbM family methyltransferase
MGKYNSFDVFDTIIGRICYKGTCIFDLMEKITGIHDFKNIRCKYEQAGIDNIYNSIRQRLPNVDIEYLKKLELELEYEFSFPIWKYLNRINSNDILISDMYLSEQQIRVLINKHISIDNKLIVSSAGKSSGRIWGDENITRDIILHTGDNKVSDYRNPMSRNIKAEWISNVEFNPVELKLSQVSFELASLVRATRLTTQTDTIMNTIFTNSLLPIGILISIHIKQLVDTCGINEVIFLSRDGYWIHHIFTILYPSIDTRYIYFSRLLAVNASTFIQTINNNNKKKLLVDLYGSGKTINSILKQMINTMYLLCFSWNEKFPENENNLVIINSSNAYVNEIETVFSAPHGTANSCGGLLNPEYDILLLKPYMEYMDIFKQYYNIYNKYDTIVLSVINKRVIEILSSIINDPYDELFTIKNHILHLPNHRPDQQSVPLKYFSQINQDKYYVEEISKFKCNGIFLDIGAYDGVTGSNTYFLEKYLNWKGVLVECNPYIIEKCKRNRTNNVCEKAIFDITDTEVEFVIPRGKEIVGGNQQLAGIKSSLRSESLTYFSESYSDSEIIKVNTISINDLFEYYNLYRVDYMSLDIEGCELKVLSQLNFDKYKILYMSVEHACIQSYKDDIYNLLISKGYRLVRTNEGDDEYILLN